MPLRVLILDTEILVLILATDLLVFIFADTEVIFGVWKSRDKQRTENNIPPDQLSALLKRICICIPLFGC